MRPNPLSHNDPIQIAAAAQQMAKNAGQDRIALAFQIVSLCSMALMGAAATVHMLKELKEDKHRRER